MSRLVADCETNGFLRELTKLHSLCFQDLDSSLKVSAKGCELESAAVALKEADKIILHNGIGFDLSALKKVFPSFTIGISKVVDTLILSRLMCPNLRNIDAKMRQLPKKMWGSHSLEAWGYRLGKHKGNYSQEMLAKGLDPWSNWNPAMQEYCEQDVEITKHLFETFEKEGIPERASELEHWFAVIMHQMELKGFNFDIRAAVRLYQKIKLEIKGLDKELNSLVSTFFTIGKEFTPKRSDRTRGYEANASFTRIEWKQFNPNSRTQIANVLQDQYGWSPPKLTEKGNVKVDEETLTTVDHPIGKLIAKRFILAKRLSQIYDGDGGWIRKYYHGKIHGRINTLGCVTGRCSHSSPNMAQVPAANPGTPYGKECRALFHAPKGYVLLGCDASGLELRCLGHFMSPYDNGEYARIVVEGDVHTDNQKAAGLPTRDMAKTFIYGFIYGAGDAKIGLIVGGTKGDGARLKRQFLEKFPALKKLMDSVAKDIKEIGFIKGIDGRKLYVRKDYSALNTLLQSAGALIVKQATVNLFKAAHLHGYVWGDDWWIVAHVHDEYQLVCKDSLKEHFAEISVESFNKAGRDFNWKCPIDAEAKIGNNWSETH